MLQEKLKGTDKVVEAAVAEANRKADARIKDLEIENNKTIDSLKNDLLLANRDKESAVKDAIANSNLKIKDLENQLITAENQKVIAVKDAISEKDIEISNLKNEIVNSKNEYKTQLESAKEQYQKDLKEKDITIEYFKDLKTRLSTKLVGETLEQHCEIQFNQLRMTAFPNAYFEKDNDTKSGSKGDYIYRECDENGVEIISIMFEMKNQNDETATKHKNEDFFKELDKDRNEKKCEYAVLVSLLETDSEYYNAGIVDVSYKYPKMYVVRPQCFIPIITLLRNAALNAAEYKHELAVVKEQNLDITNFEDKLLDFQEKFGNNYRLANDKFNKAIEEIDKTIDHLTKVKEGLLGADRNLRLANDKVQDLSIRKLTHNNPTMKEKFESLAGKAKN